MASALENAHAAAVAALQKQAAATGRQLEGVKTFEEGLASSKERSAAENEERLKTAERWVGKTKTTYEDFQKQTKPRQDTDRTIARLQAGAGNPDSDLPPTVGRGGLGDLIGSLLRAIGLG